MSNEVRPMKPIIEQIISIHERCKDSWDQRDLVDLEDAIKALKGAYEKAGQPAADSDLRGLSIRLCNILKAIEQKYNHHKEKDQANHSSKFQSLVSTLFQLLLLFCSDDSIRLILRDSCGLVELLTLCFEPTHPNTELLQIQSKLTYNIIIPYKSPTYELLIKHLFNFISTSKSTEPASNIQHALLILINLCRNNNSCKLIARQNERYKDLWKTFGGADIKHGKTLETNFLFAHFFFILNSDALTGFTLGFSLVSQYVDLILDPKSPTNYKSLSLAVDFTKSIITKLESLFGLNCDEQGGIGAKNDTELSPQHLEMTCKASEKLVKLIWDMLTKLSTFVNSLRAFEPNLGITILEFLLVLLPSYLPDSALNHCYKTSLVITQRIIKDAHKQSSLFVQGLKLYLHIFERILNTSDRNNLQLVKEFEKSIALVLNKIEIKTDSTLSSVDANVMSLRFISCVSKYEKFKDEAMKKMDANLIRALVNNLIMSSKEMISANERSTLIECLMELLSTMSNFSQNAAMLNLLLTFVSNPDVSYHIANSIQNGNNRAIKNALTVTSSTVFCENSLTSITKSLITVRSHPSDAISVDPTHTSPGLSDRNCNGAMKLEEVLTSVDILNGNSAVDNKASTLGDVVGFYRIKQELHQHEMATVNAHIVHLNNTIAHLKNLLDKQDEILSKHVLNNEVTNWEVSLAEAKYIKKVQEAGAKIAVLERDLKTMMEDVTTKTTRLNELEIADKKLKDDLEKMKKKLDEETKLRQDSQAKLKVVKEDYKNLRTENHRIKTELSDAKTKIANLEVALKREEEEVSNYKIGLEKEKRKLDTIRGLVGNNFANGLDD